MREADALGDLRRERVEHAGEGQGAELVQDLGDTRFSHDR